MKHHLEQLILAACAELHRQGVLSQVPASVLIERARDTRFGDYACNAALTLAKTAGQAPRALAQSLVAALPSSERVAKVEIAGPGFINFFLTDAAQRAVVGEIIAAGDAYGRCNIGAGQRVQVEFVSANPTGPLHVGHGRGAAYGSVVANLLDAVGFSVHREYYVNDAGRQMDILATSVWLRYLELTGLSGTFPVNGYKGEYVRDIARLVQAQYGATLSVSSTELWRDLPLDAPEGDKEIYIDALIARAKTLLGPVNYAAVFAIGLNEILADIRQDLAEFGVTYDAWYAESALVANGAPQRAIARLQARDQVYAQDGALWFKSTAHGDEKDRVLVRENGQQTYFANDIAYHLDKLERGFTRVIDIWGADHHGYVPRVKAALTALGEDAARLDVLLVQFAVLWRGGEKVQMSTRSGEFVTLRELRREVGNDAARFFYVTRSSEQHMDFDLDLAKSQSNDNPVFYIQYAHARVCSVFRELADKNGTYEASRGLAHLQRLTEPHEYALLNTLTRYSETLVAAALQHEPHTLAHYLRDLANDFHTYYNAHRFLVDDPALREARLVLIAAVRQVLRNGLRLLGVSAPEQMYS